jgi:uncharacterized protein Yka (UPF0111/DUF47 family)
MSDTCRIWPGVSHYDGVFATTEVDRFADRLEDAISLNNFKEVSGAHLSRETLSVLCRKVSLLREAARVMRHIDRLYTSDLDEQDFVKAVEQPEGND